MIRNVKKINTAKSVSAANAIPANFEKKIIQNESSDSSTVPSLQTKLAINSPNDIEEQEADAMADKVMRMPDQTRIQRKCDECEKEEEETQGKSLASTVQRKESGKVFMASDSVTNKIDSSKAGGNSMDETILSFMENRFNADFNHVKIHTNNESIQMNRELNAKAFTVNNNIYFNEGQYQPNSSEGKRLLAHELTHTIQQGQEGIGRKHIQRLTASATGTPHDGRCGGFTRSFNFTLDNPAPTDGYMVQKIERYDNEVRCPGMGACPASPTLTFYEAFFVRSGSTEFYRRAALGMTDQSGHEAKPGTSGARYAHGEIRFFPIAVTGNLGRNNTAGLWSPGNAGGVPASLSLPSTLNQPTWWDSQTEGPVKRYVNADWRCCGGSDDFNTIDSDPT
jgi:hypothetical protein